MADVQGNRKAPHERIVMCSGTLSAIGVDGIIRNLYWGQTASVRIMSELSDEYEYNEELDMDMMHLPLFSIYIRNRFSDIIIIISTKDVIVEGKHSKNIILMTRIIGRE